MRFQMPNYPCEFELPNQWVVESGLSTFMPTTSAYNSTSSAVLTPLNEIEPPIRKREVEKDWRGFGRKRMIRVMSGVVTGAEIEPVPLRELDDDGNPAAPFRYRVRDGFHRFYASVAAGFSHLPAIIL